jgi:uncharacterized protein
MWGRGPVPSDWDQLLAEARNGALLAHEKMHGEPHWRGVAWAGLKIREVFPSIRGDLLTAFAVLHDCRRETDDRDPEHGDRAARVAVRSGTLKRLVGAEGRELVAEACRLHERGQTRPETPTIGACWDADRVNLVRLGFRLDTRYFTVLSGEDGTLDALAGEARLIVSDPPGWDALFNSTIACT